MNLQSCEVINIIKPHELVVTFEDCISHDELEVLETLMTAEWDHVAHKETCRFSHGMNQHVMVRDRDSRTCRRGLIQQIIPIQDDRYKYIVYLYDHGFMCKVVPSDIMKLKEVHQQLSPRTCIVRIPGIVPAKLQIRDINGMLRGEPCQQQFGPGDKWSEPALECVRSWIKAQDKVRVAISKAVNCVVRVGDFYDKGHESLSDHLCYKNLAQLNSSKYEKDTKVSEDKSREDWKASPKRKAGLLADAVIEQTRLLQTKKEEPPKMKEEQSVKDLFAPMPDPDNCFANPYLSVPIRRTILEPDHINHNPVSKGTKKLGLDTIAFSPAPVFDISVAQQKEQRNLTTAAAPPPELKLAQTVLPSQPSISMRAQRPQLRPSPNSSGSTNSIILPENLEKRISPPVCPSVISSSSSKSENSTAVKPSPFFPTKKLSAEEKNKVLPQVQKNKTGTISPVSIARTSPTSNDSMSRHHGKTSSFSSRSSPINRSSPVNNRSSPFSSRSSPTYGNSRKMTPSPDTGEPVQRIMRVRDAESLAQFKAERAKRWSNNDQPDPVGIATVLVPTAEIKAVDSQQSIRPMISSVIKTEATLENSVVVNRRDQNTNVNSSLHNEKKEDVTNDSHKKDENSASHRPPFVCVLPKFSEWKDIYNVQSQEINKKEEGAMNVVKEEQVVSSNIVKQSSELQGVAFVPVTQKKIDPIVDKIVEVSPVKTVEVPVRDSSEDNIVSMVQVNAETETLVDATPREIATETSNDRQSSFSKEKIMPQLPSDSGVSKTLFVGPNVVSGVQSEAEFMKEMLRGRVFVTDRSVPAYKNIHNFPLLHVVRRSLKDIKFESTVDLQNRVMPYIMRGRNCFIVDSKGVGKSLAYMIPIVATVMNQAEEETNIISKNGPVAVFLAGGIPSGDILKSHLDNLLESTNFKKTIGYFVNRNDNRTIRELYHGVDIMITTPECLLEMIDEYFPYFTFDRLRYLVVDDADILMKTKMDILEKIIAGVHNGLKALGSREVPFQMIFCGGKWIPELEAAYCKVVDNPVAVLGPFQTIQFTNIPTRVYFSPTNDDKLQQTLDHLRNTAKKYNKIVIVCNTSDAVGAVKKAIGEEFKWSIRTVTHCENDDDEITTPNIDGVREWWKQSYPSSDVQIIVCTDNVLKELLIGDATNLIHYQMLTSKDRFGARFALMWEWLGGPGDDKVNAKEIIASVFLTPNEKGVDLFKVLNDLKEIGASIPLDLENHHKNLKAEHEDKARFCPGFIYYGQCESLDPSTCVYRHYPLPRDITGHPFIPKTGEIEVLITKCNTVSSYYAKLIRHYELKGGKRNLCRSYDNDLRDRHVEMTEFYDVEENQICPTMFEPNNIVAVEADGSFIRAAVESIVTRDHFSRPKAVRFFGIDTGDYVVRNVEEDPVYVLPQRFQELPKFAIELVLANMKPILGERTYSLEHKTKASREADGKILRGRICLSLGNRIWVDQLVEDGRSSDGKIRPIKSLRPKYFQIKIAERNPQHMKILYNMCKSHGHSCQEYDYLNVEDFHPGFESTFHQLEDRLDWAFIEQTFDIERPISTTLWVSFVSNPVKIIGVQEKYEEQLYKMNDELDMEITIYQEKMKNNPSQLEQLRTKYYECGMIVAAKDALMENDSTERRWVRGLICDVFEDDTDTTTYNIFYIDSGDSRNVKISEISPIPKTFVSRLPAQSIGLTLDHIKPISGQEGIPWSEEAKDYIFDRLIPDGSSERIEVVALSKKRDEDFWPISSSYSSMVYVEADEIGSALVKQNYANYVDDDAEHVVETVNAALLKQLNDAVNLQLRNGYEGGSEADDDSVSNDYGSLDDDKFDVYVGDDIFNDLLPPLEHQNNDNNRQLSRSLVNSSPSSSNNSIDSEIATINITALSPFQLQHPHLKRPEVQWHDHKEEIILRVMIPDVKKCEVTVAEDKKTLTFMTLDPPGYGFQLELYKKVEILPHVEQLGQFCKILLTKRLTNLYWEQLTKGNDKFKWIKLNVDSISAPEEGDNDDRKSSLPSIISCKKKVQESSFSKFKNHAGTINYDEYEKDDESDTDSVDSTMEQLLE